MNDAPKDFLRISCAVNRLSDGMWGGLQRPDPVAAIKQDQKKLSLGFGPWGEKAGRRLRAAAVRGKLAIYVFAKPQVRSEDHHLTDCSPEKIEPLVVPVNVVKRLIASRGGLPDHPIRPSIKTAEGNEKLFALLTVGLLVVRASDFDVWYQSERAKGRWPSQRSKSKSNGRPTKQTDPLRNAVLALIHDHKWSGKDPIAALHRVLVASGHSETPSQDTASSVGTDQLLGGPGSRPAAVDALAARTLVKGEPLTPPAGRADDFAWPRREVGREQAKGETPSASVSPDGTAAAPNAPPKPKKSLHTRPRPPVNIGGAAWGPGFFTR